MKLIAALLASAVALVLTVAVASATKPPSEPKKAYVCKYVGTPGVDEQLQTGQNPIEVAIPSLGGFTGSFPFPFSDAHGKSVAIGYVGNAYPVLTIENCPTPEGPPPPVECPEGTHEHEGQCVPNHEEPPVECEEGTHDHEGECVPDHEEPPVDPPCSFRPNCMPPPCSVRPCIGKPPTGPDAPNVVPVKPSTAPTEAELPHTS